MAPLLVCVRPSGEVTDAPRSDRRAHVQRPRRVLGGRGAGVKRRFTSPSCNPILQPKSPVSVGASWDCPGNGLENLPGNL